MRFSRLILLAMALLLICQPAFGQSNGMDSSKKSKSDLMVKSGPFTPFLEVTYGSSTPRYEGLDQDFASLGLLGLKLGYSSLDSLKYDLISSDQHFAFVDFMNADLGGSDPGANELGSELTRFGFGNRRGYGYASGIAWEMYNQDGIGWSQLKPVDYQNMDESAQELFDHFGTSYRFGQQTEAGLKFHLSKSFALTGGFEGAVILPRYVFWPWLGSVAIYSGVQGALEVFSANIIEASPKAGPVIAFLLKTGASAGYYYLLKDDMNWPFNYEAPLQVSSFKVGANFKF